MFRLIKFAKPQFLFVLLILLILGCNNSVNKRPQNRNKTISAFDSAQGRSFTYSKYELPLSVDIYKFLKKEKIPFNILMMHKFKDQDKYFTETKRAFAMGVYSSDLAYTAVYEQSQDAVEYIGATIDLANKLNIQDGYNSNTLDRAYKNLDNADSLSYIVGESYFKTCSVLEKSKRNNVLPLIVVGSWVESMHILSRNCVGKTEGSPLFNELFLQFKHLDNLILYLKDTSDKMEASTSKTEIVMLSSKLELIKQKYSLIESKDPSNFSLGQFKDVIFQIEDLRNSIIE